MQQFFAYATFFLIFKMQFWFLQEMNFFDKNF